MGGDGGARSEARRARETEDAREQRIKMGTGDIRTRFGKAFDDKYYQGLETTAKDFYGKQLTSDYEKARQQLQYALARNGLLNSTVRDTREVEAQKQLALGQQSIAERARGLSNQRRQDVAGAEQTAVSQLTASADPAAAAAQSANLIKANTALPEFSPMGQVFQDFTAGLATQADLERQGKNRYNLGVSGWGNNARRYVQNVSG